MRYRWERVWSQDGKSLQGNPTNAEMHRLMHQMHHQSPGQALLLPVTNPTNPASPFENCKFRSPPNFRNLTGLSDNPLRAARQRSSSQQYHRNHNKETEAWAGKVFVRRYICAFSLLHRYLWTDRSTGKPECVFPQSMLIIPTQQRGSSGTNTTLCTKA